MINNKDFILSRLRHEKGDIRHTTRGLTSVYTPIFLPSIKTDITEVHRRE